VGPRSLNDRKGTLNRRLPQSAELERAGFRHMAY